MSISLHRPFAPATTTKGGESYFTVRRRSRQSQRLDPDDLCRRLNAHLAEQEEQAERRRVAKVARVVQQQQQPDEIYHHVPKVAASAFEKTASPDVFRISHKLSAPVMRAHIGALNLDQPSLGRSATGLKRTQALDLATQENGIMRNRNQFQWVNGMAEADVIAEMERNLCRPPQRSFNSDFAFLRAMHGEGITRPMSAGDVMGRGKGGSAMNQRTRIAYDPNNRNDWTQRDDLDNIAGKKDRPLLQKKESRWLLVGRKDKIGTPEQEDMVKIHGSPPIGSRTEKSGFLARFKRSPS